MKFRPGIRPFDIVIIVLAAGICLAAVFFVYFRGSSRREVVVEGPGRKWVFPADAEEIVRVPGPIGITEVEIHAGSARVLSSPCDNQTCVAAGKISNFGQWIACLPNQVFVYIEGKDKNKDDGVDGSTW